MFSLANEKLSVSVLDPRTDTLHLGSRYCTGGYIWQIEDSVAGPLLTGPQFPSPTPLPFHGQGAPEAFVTPLGCDDVAAGETVTVIGVGEVLRTSGNTPFHVRDNPTVQRFCRWSIEAGTDTITMTTEQQSGDFAVSLTRSVSLDGNVVVSETEILNRSADELPIRWFPHPFFPLNADGTCCRLDFRWSIPENSGYDKNDRGLLVRKKEYPWEKGLFLKLEIPGNVHLHAEVQHPVGKTVSLTTDYPLESLPVWANDRTFSLEPYLSAAVIAGERVRWSVAYRF